MAWSQFEEKVIRDMAELFPDLAIRLISELKTGSPTTIRASACWIVELAASRKLPAIYPFREFAVIGGLMSYGADLKDRWRRAATYVDKILKGAKPADLPVEQPTRFQLVVNLQTAQALGLTLPPLILPTADEVIE